MNKFERGSEWRKWDLHIHSPETFLNNQFQDNWEEWFDNIKKSNLKVIGLTNYFRFNNNEIKKAKDELGSDVLILPNLEFRLTQTNNKNNAINIHLLFSDKTDIEKINGFLGRLKTLGDKYCSHLNNEDINNVTIGLDTIRQSLKDDTDIQHLQDYLVVGCPRGHGNFRPSNDDGRGNNTAKEIDKFCDLFLGNEDDTEFFLNKEKARFTGAIKKPVVHSSDAHKLDDIGKKFTWIKADLTFEGLKQIICEPQDRVKIQANKPEEKSGYHVIKSIVIDNDICKQTILLNPNLNAIIGGRSTGKSTLLKLIACRINSKIEKDVKNSIDYIPQDSIKIIWQDDEENKDRYIEFFQQNHMHKIASDKDKENKNKLIQDIVAEKDNKNLISNYDKFCFNNRIALQTNIDNLFKLQNEINKLTATLKEKGDEDGIKKEIEILQDKIKKSRQDNSFSEDELEQFEGYKKNILELEQLQQKLEQDKNEITTLKDEDLFNTSFSYKFSQLSELNSKDIQKIFDDVKQQAIEQWQDELSNKLVEMDSLLEEYKNKIQEKKESEIFKKGNKYLEKNNQYKELNGKWSIENKKLEEIVSLQNKRDIINKQKDELFKETIQNHISYKRKINELIRKFSLEHDDIKIKIEKTYLHDKCKGLLKDFINLQSHDRQNYVKDFISRYKNNIEFAVKDFLEKALNNDLELKKYKDIKYLTKGLLVENWFSVSYELTYQDDTFEKMSDGKKAFVILKLLLDFNDKKCPILIDQPEDSLDNRAIYNELVTYLKQKKKDRQIILVTHNANIVVNADAEEVIVANQHGDNSKNTNDIKFEYISGSLENTIMKNQNTSIVLKSQGIREHTCEILEGGTEAFKKRENKYAIN